MNYTAPGALPYAGALALLLVWDVALAGRISQLRKAAPLFRSVTGLCGFLVVPALLLQAGAESAVTSHALGAIAWFAPFVLVLFCVQSAIALGRRLVSPAVALPILLFNLTLAFIAIVRALLAAGVALPPVLLVPGLAQSQLLSLVLGTGAIASPLAIGVPILAPAYPPRWRISNAMRGALALGALAVLVLEGIAVPAAWRGTDDWRTIGNDRVGERVRGSFASALRILPVLGAAPQPSTLRDDLALADSLDVQALFVRAGGGATAAALDSLGRALDSYRRDSTALLVAISAPASERTRVVDRVMRRLHPDYVVLPGEWGLARIELSAAEIRHLRPVTKVAIELSHFDRADSALFAASALATEAVFFSVQPAPGGGSRVAGALATVDRWVQHEGHPREHWLLAAAAPLVDGDDAQRRLMRHAIAWSSSRASFAGVVFADASDYDRGTGLRAADGRLRAAVGDAAAAIRALAESSPAPSPVTAPDPVPTP